MANTVEISTLHSELGPSASDRWLPCPGSVLLIRGLDDPDSIYAAEGNAAHELSEWCRVEKKPADHWRGTIIKVGKFEFEVDQEMIDAINEFVEYVDQFPGEALYEAKVSYSLWVPTGFGTLDDGRLQDCVARVTDLKYGKGVWVFAKDNSQLKMYALGLYHDYKHLYDFKKFILTIHQPRLENVDTFELTLDELLDWAENTVKPIAERALKPGAEFKAGDHCVFCPAKGSCKVRQEYVTKAALSDFENLESEPREVAFMTNDEIALVLPKLPNIKKWCGDVAAHARSEVAKGNLVTHPELGNYKMVEGRSRRVWKGKEEDVIAGLTLEVDDMESLWERNFTTPAKAEKILGKKVDISDLIFKPKGAPVLVDGTDERESLEIKPEDEFEDVENG